MNPSSAFTCIAFVFTFFNALVIENAEADLRVRFKIICQALMQLNLDEFMDKSLAEFEYLCKSMSSADALSYRNMYNDIFASTFAIFNEGSAHFYAANKPGLIATDNVTTFLMEFAVGKSSAEAMAEIEKYKSNSYAAKLDILGVGVNFKYEMAPKGARKTNASAIDRLKCEWEAKLYSDTGEVKKTFPEKTAVLDCP